MKNLIIVLVVFLFVQCSQQDKTVSEQSIVLNLENTGDTISRNIYGHFSEHLGRCIYEGIWVGEKSPIPNTRGIRNDVVEALKRIAIPNLRWPGGCFADEYHWMEGIGPKESRPKMVNTNWGGVVEDNSFGTHEFMDLCEQLNCEPVICGNIGSGTVNEMSEWVEYLTSDAVSPMTELRKKNGREKPWKVKFWCVGNETWGCGGIMSPDFYSQEMARYSFFLKNYGNNVLYKIASGGTEADYVWTEEIMKKWQEAPGYVKGFLNGYSLHYYTVANTWDKKGSATNFNEKEWFSTMMKTMRMEELVTKHSEVMDQYDSAKTIGLIVDEWGNWHDVEPGTNPGFLYQQNSLRDAMVAAINLNIFNNHCDRVKMSNIAQVVNVLQSVILTQGEKMIVTPTFYVFEMYKVHHDAVLIPVNYTSPDYVSEGEKVPAITMSASKDSAGSVHITISNCDPTKDHELTFALEGANTSSVSGKIITSQNLTDHNTFENPEVVKTQEFNSMKLEGNNLNIQMPAKSIVMIELK